MPPWPSPVYRFAVEFDVPLSFAFRWCTDYRPDDARLHGERYDRRILRRSSASVLYEDLWWEPDGWRWRRNVVALHPPNFWHCDSFGSVRDASLDYRLTALPGDRCRLTLIMRRRPSSSRPQQPSARAMEEDLRGMWNGYARAMLQDFRARRSPARAPRRRAAPRRHRS